MKLIKSYIWLSLNSIPIIKFKVCKELKKTLSLVTKKIRKIFKSGMILECAVQSLLKNLLKKKENKGL